MSKQERNTRLFLADILQAAYEITQYAALDKSAFLMDRMRQRAVVQCFEIMGEATKKLPQTLRAAHNEIPWKYMAAFRDKLIHDYFEIDMHLVWTSAQREIPQLIPLLETLLKEIPE